MPYALAATRVANLVSNNPKITAGAVLVAGAAFQKFAESGVLRVSGAISDYGGIFETATDKAGLGAAAKVLGVAGTAIALGKAAAIGFERGAMGESLDIASLASGVVTRTIDEITSGVSNTIDAAKKGELATAALTATQTALAVSGIKDIPTSIATEYAAQLVGRGANELLGKPVRDAMMVANMAAVKPVYPGIKPFIPNPDLMKAKLTARSKVTFKESSRSPSNTPAAGKSTSSNQQLS